MYGVCTLLKYCFIIHHPPLTCTTTPPLGPGRRPQFCPIAMKHAAETGRGRIGRAETSGFEGWGWKRSDLKGFSAQLGLGDGCLMVW